MTTRPQLLQRLRYPGNPSPGTYVQAVDLSVWEKLRSLGDEMFGARQPTANSQITRTLRNQGLLRDDQAYDGRYRGDWFKTNDFFIGDAPQGQDGKNIENEVNPTYRINSMVFLGQNPASLTRFPCMLPRSLAKELIACQQQHRWT